MVVNALWGIWQGSWWSDMAESMKNAWQGQGEGLQGASTAIGNVAVENMQSSGQKRADAANGSLVEMAEGGERTGPTVAGTNVDAATQSANQHAGSADHLGVAMKK